MALPSLTDLIMGSGSVRSRDMIVGLSFLLYSLFQPDGYNNNEQNTEHYGESQVDLFCCKSSIRRGCRFANGCR